MKRVKPYECLPELLIDNLELDVQGSYFHKNGYLSSC